MRRVHRFLQPFYLSRIFTSGYPTGINNIDSSMGGQLMGILTFLPLGFLSGYVMSWVLKKLNLAPR